MEYLLAALAVYRVARMIALEDGPLNLFAKLQDWAEPRQEKNWFAKGILCPLCLSWWLALPTLYFFQPLSAAQYMLTWLAIAGGAAVLYLITER